MDNVRGNNSSKLIFQLMNLNRIAFRFLKISGPNFGRDDETCDSDADNGQTSDANAVTITWIRQHLACINCLCSSCRSPPLH